MINKIYFATCNSGKVKEFKQILNGVDVEQLAIDYPELRSDDPREIAELAAKQLAEIVKKPIVVEDSGLFIRALKDFPGTSSAYIHKRIGLKGILRLMEGVKDRVAYYKSAVGYCKPGKNPISFLGEEKVTISKKIKGSKGFGHDPITIPSGSRKTYGELGQDCKKFRKQAVLKLMKFLKK